MATSSTRIQSLWDRFVELIAPASTGDGGPDLCWRRVLTVFASGGAFVSANAPNPHVEQAYQKVASCSC